MIITFSGLDGSGKTTLADKVYEHLKEKGHRVKYFHAIKNSFYYYLLHKAIGRVSKSSQGALESGLRDNSNRPRFLILACIKKIFFLFQLVIFRLMFRDKKGNATDHLVCDRYFYDDIVQFAYLGVDTNRLLRLLKILLVAPDISFLLEVNPQRAYERKPEYASGYFQAKAALYRNILVSFKAVAVPESDITESLKFVVREFVRSV